MPKERGMPIEAPPSVCVRHDLTLSPERIVLDGGVMRRPLLLPRIRRLRELACGYFDVIELGPAIDEYAVSLALGRINGSSRYFEVRGIGSRRKLHLLPLPSS